MALAFAALNVYGTWRQQAVWAKGELVSVGWARQETGEWLRIGDLLRHIAQPGDTLATSAGGAVPYRSRLYTIEMNGITATDLSRFRRRPSQRPGHLITLDERQMIERPPQILLGHPSAPHARELALGLDCGRISHRVLRPLSLRLTRRNPPRSWLAVATTSRADPRRGDAKLTEPRACSREHRRPTSGA